MKKILSVTTLFLFLSVCLFSQHKSDNKGVVFNEGTLAEALAKAKSNKEGPNLVFVDCYTSWCGPCKRMANEVFTQEHVGRFFNENFINFKVDLGKGEGPEISKRYDIMVYPTFLILDSDGNEVNRVAGADEADKFIEKVRRAMDPKNSPKARRAVYDADKSYKNALSYLEVLEGGYFKKDIKMFLEEIFLTLTPEERYSEKMWPYLSESLGDPTSKLFDIVIAEKPIVDKYLYKERVDDVICSGLKKYAISYLRGRRVSPEDIEKKIKYLGLLSDNDVVVPYILKAVNLYSENNIPAIEEMLNVEEIMKFGPDIARKIDRGLLFRVKGLSNEKILEYLEAKKEYLNKKIVEVDANIEKYTK